MNVERRLYLTWFSGLQSMSAKRMLRYFDPKHGHYWADKTVRITYDYAMEHGERHHAAIRKAWPEAERIEWVGENEKGTFWLAYAPE